MIDVLFTYSFPACAYTCGAMHTCTWILLMRLRTSLAIGSSARVFLHQVCACKACPGHVPIGKPRCGRTMHDAKQQMVSDLLRDTNLHSQHVRESRDCGYCVPKTGGTSWTPTDRTQGNLIILVPLFVQQTAVVKRTASCPSPSGQLGPHVSTPTAANVYPVLTYMENTLPPSQSFIY